MAGTEARPTTRGVFSGLVDFSEVNQKALYGALTAAAVVALLTLSTVATCNRAGESFAVRGTLQKIGAMVTPALQVFTDATQSLGQIGQGLPTNTSR